MARGLAVLGLLAACGPRHAATPHADDAGLTIVIYAPRGGEGGGRAHVDDRRWVEVPADGEIELVGVSSSLALDSVVIDSMSDPGALATSRCQVVATAAGLRDGAWLVGREVAIVTAAGGKLAGTVVEVGDPVAVLEAADGGRLRAAPGTLALDRGGEDGEPRAPVAGEAAVAISLDGGEVAGTLRAIEPERLVVRGADGRRSEVRVDAIVQLGVAGAPAETALRCLVRTARAGRQLVRLSYATGDVAWRAGYRIVLAAGDAERELETVEVVPQLEIHAPGFPVRRTARVRLIAGLPDDSEPPVDAWAGAVTLGGGDVSVRGPGSPRRARLERVFRGAVAHADDNDRYPDWRSESQPAVWRELAFERAPADVPGPVRVGIAQAGGAIEWIDGELPAAPADGAPSAVRLPLWVEPALVGFRQKSPRDVDGSLLVDQVQFSVANRGEVAVTVVVEELVRTVARPTIVFERPEGAGELRGGRWRTRLEIPPGEVRKGTVALEYRFSRY